MALDRQRILTELGSVVNQLQSADCGCMGKLFKNPGQNGLIPMGHPLPTCGGCRRGCCHGHGYSRWNSGGPCGDLYTMNHQPGMQRGDPYTMNSPQAMQRPFMGHCNSPKLYADTYTNLKENVMQPTVKKVCNDLSNITPENTIMTNPMANQIVGPKNAFAPQSNSGGDSQYTGFPKTNMTNMSNKMESMQNKEPMGKLMEHMNGMGPPIMNMFGSKPAPELGSIRSNDDQGGNWLAGPMLIDEPQSTHRTLDVTPLSAAMRNNEGIYRNNNVVGYQYPISNQYNNTMGANISNTIPNFQNMQGSQNISNLKTNPATQQMEASHQHHHGLMFPVVMKGGDSNFNPMAKAIQMNPANQMTSNNNTGINEMFDRTYATPERPEIKTINNCKITHNQQNVPQVQNINSEQIKNSNIPFQNYNLYKAPCEKNQQIYTAVTQQPISQHQTGQQYKQQQPISQHQTGQQNQQYLQRLPYQTEQQNQQYKQQQTTVDPKCRNAVPSPRLPTLYEGALGNQNDLSQVPNTNVVSEVPDNQQMIKEPKFPEEKRYEYNTLGQPIEMLPAKVYHICEPALPQTLSPQPLQRAPCNASRFSNVKSTVSKTSLMGTKAIGRTASRSQLQGIYNQYKGCQPYTHHNVRASDNGVSYSDGMLNIHRTNIPAAQQNIPIERVGGDAIPIQVLDQNTNKVKQVVGQIGDAPPGVIKPTGDIMNPQVTTQKIRNGLQDQVFTSYANAAAWSFHGVGAPPYFSGYSNRYRV